MLRLGFALVADAVFLVGTCGIGPLIASSCDEPSFTGRVLQNIHDENLAKNCVEIAKTCKQESKK